MKRFTKNIIIYVIIFAVVLVAATAYRGMNDSQTVQVREVPLSQFVQYLQDVYKRQGQGPGQKG